MGYSATQAGMVMAPGGLATLVTMPFVGAWIRRHDGRKVILAGLVLGAFSMYLMRGFTLEASYWDFMWPRVLLGLALAFIFPPLSTLTLAAIPREQMGNATGMYNLLRNIGGSVGIAMTATFLARFAQSFQTNLVSHVNPYNPIFQSKLWQLKQAAMAKGMDAVTAQNAAMEVIYLTVRRQAGILTYDYIFWLIGLAFLGTIPFLLLLRKPRLSA
jgi:DHA2 family multidrug resistance protein